jgi:hypothetical protein
MSKMARQTLMSDAEATFYGAVDSAEQTRATAMKAATTQAQVTAADVAYHRAVVAAATTSGQPHLGGPSRAALHELTGLYA